MSRAVPKPEIAVVCVPFRVVKRGGRKEIRLPDGLQPRQRRSADNTLVKALARAFRWKRMLESSEFATMNELAEREGISASYLTRMMRLAQLAPELVESLLEGSQPRDLTLETLRKPLPFSWIDQKRVLGIESSPNELTQIRGFPARVKRAKIPK